MVATLSLRDTTVLFSVNKKTNQIKFKFKAAVNFKFVGNDLLINDYEIFLQFNYIPTISNFPSVCKRADCNYRDLLQRFRS